MAAAFTAAEVETVAQALAHGLGQGAAAAAVGVSRRTIARRLEDQPEIERRAREIRAGLLSDATGRLAALASKAAATLEALLDDEQAGVRLQAASVVLSHGLKMRDAVDLADQVRRLEERATPYTTTAAAYGAAS